MHGTARLIRRMLLLQRLAGSPSFGTAIAVLGLVLGLVGSLYSVEIPQVVSMTVNLRGLRAIPIVARTARNRGAKGAAWFYRFWATMQSGCPNWSDGPGVIGAVTTVPRGLGNCG